MKTRFFFRAAMLTAAGLALPTMGWAIGPNSQAKPMEAPRWDARSAATTVEQRLSEPSRAPALRLRIPAGTTVRPGAQSPPSAGTGASVRPRPGSSVVRPQVPMGVVRPFPIWPPTRVPSQPQASATVRPSVGGGIRPLPSATIPVRPLGTALPLQPSPNPSPAPSPSPSTPPGGSIPPLRDNEDFTTPTTPTSPPGGSMPPFRDNEDFTTPAPATPTPATPTSPPGGSIPPFRDNENFTTPTTPGTAPPDPPTVPTPDVPATPTPEGQVGPGPAVTPNPTVTPPGGETVPPVVTPDRPRPTPPRFPPDIYPPTQQTPPRFPEQYQEQPPTWTPPQYQQQYGKYYGKRKRPGYPTWPSYPSYSQYPDYPRYPDYPQYPIPRPPVDPEHGRVPVYPLVPRPLPVDPSMGGRQPDMLRDPSRGLTEPADVIASCSDPAFERYVDLELLARAWGTMDSALLADAGLQLAEGERVLCRPHVAFPSRDVLDRAIALAGEKNDAATLKRLAVALKEQKELAAKVAEAQKNRKADADRAAQKLTGQMAPEVRSLYENMLAKIQAAKLGADRAALLGIEQDIPTIKTFSEPQRAHMKKLVTQALASLPKDPPVKAAALLNALAEASRQSAVIEGEAAGVRHAANWGFDYRLERTGTGYSISVLHVYDGTPAHRAQLDPGDRITKINSQPIKEYRDVEQPRGTTAFEIVNARRGQPEWYWLFLP